MSTSAFKQKNVRRTSTPNGRERVNCLRDCFPNPLFMMTKKEIEFMVVLTKAKLEESEQILIIS